ncbi:MAG: amino acid adenylation domain-containing protein [Hydrococcus sp. CRU_1_1]|nr:amino acid adenylation domain-containing protein [Hydrococcus sp. CRU_1_1]
MNKNNNIEDAYPLSPMQQGMLFHSIYAPGTGVYIGQVDFELRGQLNTTALIQAWEQVVQRHSVLRTACVWENLQQPIQVVVRQVKIPWQEQDWRELSPKQQQEKLKALLKEDIHEDFDFSKAPLIRLTLIRLDEATYHFIWTYHLLLFDGWSLPLIYKEVFSYYQAFSQDQNLYLEKPRPYKDYIAWLQQQNPEKSEFFWRKTLKNCTVASFLNAKKQLSEQKDNYTKQSIKLSAITTSSLHSLARKYQVTLNTLVQGAWALLLSKYTGKEDIIFGATVSGRPHSLNQANSIIGLFINTLPVRVKINYQQSLLAWFQQIQEQQIEARLYEYTPLVDIQRWSEIPANIPLFESIVVFENYPQEKISLQKSGLNLEIKVCDRFDRTNYPLTIIVIPGNELLLEIVYDKSKGLDDTTVERILKHIEVLLKGIAANPQQCLKELSILTQAERQQLLVEWNNTETEYPQNKCIQILFEEQVEYTPDSVALVFENQHLTYRELNNKANQLARYLQSLGVKTDVIVGICMERSLEMVIAILAILKAGGAYLPLDPTYPKERLAFMMADAQVSVLLTQSHLVETLPSQQQAAIICLDRDDPILTAYQSRKNLICEVKPENLAYVIYTSGSTGTPKGVLNTHLGLSNRLLWMQDEYNLTFCDSLRETGHSSWKRRCAPQPLRCADRILQKTPFSFDVSVWEFFWPLFTGASLVLASPEGHRDSTYLVDLIATEQITTLHFVPSMLQVFLEEPQLERCHSLKRVFCSGESLSLSLQERFFARVDAELHNLYGPTEASIDVTYWRCQRRSDRQFVPIGRAIANTQIYILDRYLQPVPIGVIGELYIGGVGLARGYLNRTELTAEKFIPNPFSHHAGARLYQTGDKARYLPDGNIEYIGRIDRQIKLRGFRIELGEIETQLEQHPHIKQAVVQVREDSSNRQRLVAYLISDREISPTTKELRSYLKEKLPEYTIPSVFLFLDALPLTPNGKIDRKALPTPEITTIEREEIIAPRTSIEEKLVKIWAEVLQVDKIGVENNFFELGGDSIVSLQVIAKANQAGLQLTPKQIFEHQTIAELATVAKITTTKIAEQGLVTGTLSLTPIQHRFFEQKFADLHHYNQSVMLKVHDGDPIVLEKSLQYLWAHHDILRSRFVETQSGWQSIIQGFSQTVPFSVIDLSQLRPSQQKEKMEAIATRLQSSFNLTKGELVRIVWFDLGKEQSSRLLIIIHHLIVDGVSWRILLQDLEAIYQQLDRNKTIQLPAKTTSYQQWGKQLQKYAQSTTVEQELDYWLNQLESSKNILQTLPTDVPEGNNTLASIATVSVILTDEETKALLYEVPSTYQTQINDVLLAALVQTFQQWTGNNSLLIELEGHGREDILENIDLSRTVGWFTTLFPVLLDLGTNSNPGETLKTIKEQLRSIPHRGINYGILRYLSNKESIKKKLQNLSQPEVRFNYLGQFDRVIANSIFHPVTESTGRERSLKGHRDCLLEIDGAISLNRLRLDWSYSQALHRETTIQQLAETYIEKLRSLIAHCQSPDSGGYTPSDFSEFQQSQWNESDLESITAVIRGM